MAFKLVISEGKKSHQVEVETAESKKLIGLIIGEEFDASLVGLAKCPIHNQQVERAAHVSLTTLPRRSSKACKPQTAKRTNENPHRVPYLAKSHAIILSRYYHWPRFLGFAADVFRCVGHHSKPGGQHF